jgi:hypothetical protein
VVCSISHECVAVGNDGPTSNYQTLIEWSNGSKWGLVKSPNRTGRSNSLSSVSCFLPSWCEAVGSSGQGYMSKTLIVRFG